jgi:hypothetical protein
MEAYSVLSRGKWFKVAVILVMILYLVIPFANNINSQYCKFERMVYGETYCDYIEGSWVLTLEVIANGDLGVWISKIYVFDQEVRYQISDVTYVNYRGIMFHEDDLNSKTAIEIPEGEHGFIQFKVSEGKVSGEEIKVILQNKGAMDYYNTISTTMTEPMDLELLGAKLYNMYIHWYKIKTMKQWMPPYIYICIWIGILLDGYMTRRSKPYVYDWYA